MAGGQTPTCGAREIIFAYQLQTKIREKRDRETVVSHPLCSGALGSPSVILRAGWLTETTGTQSIFLLVVNKTERHQDVRT